MESDRHVDLAIAPPTHKGVLEGLPDMMLQPQSNQFYVAHGPKLKDHELRTWCSTRAPGGQDIPLLSGLEGLPEMS